MRIIARAEQRGSSRGGSGSGSIHTRMRFMQALQKNHLNRWRTATLTAPNYAETAMAAATAMAVMAAAAAFATLIAYAINLVN